MALTYGDNVIEGVAEWYRLLRDVASDWGRLMDTVWPDLPPDLAEKVLKASTAFADAGDALREALQSGEDETATDEH